MDDRTIKLGALIWPQYTDWQSLLDFGRQADSVGYDSLWTWDHLYPIVGSPEGPIFEGYLTLAGWAMVTERATLGLMVGANTFRNPALTAKIATTLDHMSRGRAILGIGGAWFETEHTGYGIDFGSGFGERLDWLDEAVEVMRSMADGKPVSARGPRYQMNEVRNDPPPVQPRLPILIGGSGEQKTLRTTARYADAWNLSGSPDVVRHKEHVLRERCEEVGRDHREIERTFSAGATVIRNDRTEAERVGRAMGERNRGWDGVDHVETPDETVERLRPIVELGFRHIYVDFPAPFDAETLERFATEIKPRLEEIPTLES